MFTQILMNYRYPFATCLCIPHHAFEIHTNSGEGERKKGERWGFCCICNLYFFEVGVGRERGLLICWTSFSLWLPSFSSFLCFSVGIGAGQQLPFLGHGSPTEWSDGHLFSKASPISTEIPLGSSLSLGLWNCLGVGVGGRNRSLFLLVPFLLSLPS